MLWRLLAAIYNRFPTSVQRRILDRANPRFLVGVNGLGVGQDGAVILARHRFGSARWRLLGGFIHREESLETALAREIKEETGLDVEVGPVLEANSTRRWAHVEVIYAFRPIGGELAIAGELLELRSFPPDELPAMRSDHRGIVDRHLAAVAAWARGRSDPATIALTR